MLLQELKKQAIQLSASDRLALIRDLLQSLQPTPPIKDWQYLVSHPHPWRRQLYIKGRKLLASTVWQDMLTNEMSPQQAAENWDLPFSIICEATKTQQILLRAGFRGLNPAYTSDIAFTSSTAFWNKAKNQKHAIDPSENKPKAFVVVLTVVNFELGFMRFRSLMLLFGTLLVLALSQIFISQAYGQSDRANVMQVSSLGRFFLDDEGCLFVSDWDSPYYRNTQVVIEDEQALRDRVRIESSEYCTERDYPKIDWSQYTLIGTQIFIQGGCSGGRPSTFAIQVARDDSQRIYKHTAIVNPGPCAGGSRSQSWVLVPKLPVGYKVKFEKTQDPSMVMYCDDRWDD